MAAKAATGKTAPHAGHLIVDATAGLGRDGLQLALAGYRVVMVERCLPVALLLCDAILTARTLCGTAGGFGAAVTDRIAMVYQPLGAEKFLTHVGDAHCHMGDSCRVPAAEPCQPSVINNEADFWRHITGSGSLELQQQRLAGSGPESRILLPVPVHLLSEIPAFVVPFGVACADSESTDSTGFCWWRALGLRNTDMLSAVIIDPMWDVAADTDPLGRARSTLRRKASQQRDLQYLEALSAPTSQSEIRQVISLAARAVASHRDNVRTGVLHTPSVVVKQHVRAPALWQRCESAEVRLRQTIAGKVARFDLYAATAATALSQLA